MLNKGDNVEVTIEIKSLGIFKDRTYEVIEESNKDHMVLIKDKFNRTFLMHNQSLKKIKEEKMENIKVSSWEDLKEHCCRVEEEKDGKIYIFYPLQIEIRIDERTTHLKYAVDLINKIFTDQNFEYVEIEVIDAFPKFKEFLKENNLKYCPVDKRPIEGVTENAKLQVNMHIDSVEKKYNVDLKILKG